MSWVSKTWKNRSQGAPTTPIDAAGLNDLESRIGTLADSVVTTSEATRIEDFEGAAVFRNDPEPWFGESYSIGTDPNSVGGAVPTAAPATTVGTGGFTFPLTFPSTVPVADCAALDARGGSMTIGGHIVAYTGRSASSGAGNATGCMSLPTATGTVAEGAAITNTPLGFFALTIYQRFGYDNPNAPIPGRTQGGGCNTYYYGPTVDDVMESFHGFCGMMATDDPYAQYDQITALEGNAHVAAGNALIGSDMCGVGGRTVVNGFAERAANIKASGLSDSSGYVYQFAALWQKTTGRQAFGQVDGSVTAGSNRTITFDNATVRPPEPTALVPTQTVWISTNPENLDGISVTYTGVTGSGTTGTLTGCEVSANIPDNARISNLAYGVEVLDPIKAPSLALARTGRAAGLQFSTYGNVDSSSSTLRLTLPSHAEVPGAAGLLITQPDASGTGNLVEIRNSSGTQHRLLTSGGAWQTVGTIGSASAGFAAYIARMDSRGLTFTEKSDTTAPSANEVVLYARDNGGKTELCARFNTGAIQVLSTEP